MAESFYIPINCILEFQSLHILANPCYVFVVCDSFLKPHFFSWLVFTQAFHGLALAMGTGRFPSHSTLAWGSRENWWVPFEGGIWLLWWKKLSAWGAWEMFLLLAKQWSCHVNGPIDLWKEMVLPAGGYKEMRMEKYHGQILHITKIKAAFVVEEFSLSYELGRESWWKVLSDSPEQTWSSQSFYVFHQIWILRNDFSMWITSLSHLWTSILRPEGECSYISRMLLFQIKFFKRRTQLLS